MKAYIRVKNNQLDPQLILSVFRQPLHVSVVSRPIFRGYKSICTTIGTYSNILIHIQQDATLHSLFYLETALHVSGGTIIHHQERR